MSFFLVENIREKKNTENVINFLKFFSLQFKNGMWKISTGKNRNAKALCDGKLNFLELTKKKKIFIF